MSAKVTRDERKPKSGRPKIVASKKRPNLLAVLRDQEDPEFFIDETFYPERYQPLYEH